MEERSLISPEVLVPRLGEQLVEAGLLSAGQLRQALAHQRQSAAAGTPLLLGDALIELGLLDRPTLNRAVTEQILRLRQALEDANRNLEARVQQRTAELEEALRKLSELNQLKANFIANISHELRTPLTHIRGYLELMQGEGLGDLNEEQKKAIEVSFRATARLQNLIDDLILFSQASHGEMTLTLRPVHLPQLAQAATRQAHHKAEEKKISLSLEIQPGITHAQADYEKLGWVLSQLLDNAIKFTHPGGQVTLSLSTEPKTDTIIHITVTDTGIGISPEKITEIFEPFHQLDGSATRRYGGTGLGLALVREIVEAHGSLIEVQSEIGKGTQISFPLLVAKEN
jgi:signal transduction histidine kinase